MSSTVPLNRTNYLNVVAYVINVLCTYIVGNGGLPGAQSNPELSAKYQTLVTPAGFAFAIWGIIFLAQGLFSVLQLLPAFRASELVQGDGIGFNYIYVCLAQSVWTFVFAYEFIEASVVCMLTILFFLVRIVTRQAKVESTSSIRDFWLLKFPFSIHCGWIVAASFVNIAVVLVKLEVGATIEYYTALGSLFGALVITALALYRKEYIIPTVLSWATFGIYSELGSPPELISSKFEASTIEFVRTGAGLVSLVIALAVVVKFAVDFVRSRSSSESNNEQDYRRVDDNNPIRPRNNV